MLDALHRHMQLGIPFFGMNRGTVGFLMNAFEEDRLTERLRRATPTTLSPLRMKATRFGGAEIELLAINEVSLHRQTGQASRIRVSIDGRVRLDEIICDGILVATPDRQLRVQPLRPRPDPSPERGGARAHRDQSVPPPTLARGRCFRARRGYASTCSIRRSGRSARVPMRRETRDVVAVEVPGGSGHRNAACSSTPSATSKNAS